MSYNDRRRRRTHELLEKAFLELMAERGYNAVTIQEIVERAGVGRATFYRHYGGKDELFLRCHEAFIKRFGIYPPVREELLAPEPPATMVAAYRHLAEVRPVLSPILLGYAKDSGLLLRRMRQSCARRIEESLRVAFPAKEETVPAELVANFLAGAQLGLLHWWFERHLPGPPEHLARAFHRLRQGVISAAFGPAP